jgi:hypothetical protein
MPLSLAGASPDTVIKLKLPVSPPLTILNIQESEKLSIFNERMSWISTIGTGSGIPGSFPGKK